MPVSILLFLEFNSFNFSSICCFPVIRPSLPLICIILAMRNDRHIYQNFNLHGFCPTCFSTDHLTIAAYYYLQTRLLPCAHSWGGTSSQAPPQHLPRPRWGSLPPPPLVSPLLPCCECMGAVAFENAAAPPLPALRTHAMPLGAGITSSLFLGRLG